MIEIMADSLVNSEVNIKGRLVEPAILVTLTPNSISARINSERRLNPDGFNQAIVFVHTLTGAAIAEPENIDRVDEVELLQLIESATQASHSLDRTAVLLRNNRTNKNISSTDNKEVYEQAQLLASKYASYAATLRGEFEQRRDSDQAEPMIMPNVIRKVGEIVTAGATFANTVTAGGAINNSHVRTVDEVFAGGHPYYIKDLGGNKQDIKTINLYNLKKAATLAQSLNKNGQTAEIIPNPEKKINSGGDPMPNFNNLNSQKNKLHDAWKNEDDLADKTAATQVPEISSIPTQPDQPVNVEQKISVGSVDLHQIPKSAEQILLESANLTLPNDQKLKDIPDKGIKFEAYKIEEVQKILDILTGNNENVDPQLLQSIADNWSTIVQMTQQYGEGSATMEFYLFKKGMTQGVSFKKEAKNFQNSGVDMPAGSFWGNDGKQLLPFDLDVNKLDSSKVSTGIFIVPVADYIDSLRAAADKGIDISLLPKDGYIIAQLLSVKGVSNKHWLVSTISPEGKPITFNVPAIENLINDANQMSAMKATEVPADLTTNIFTKNVVPETVPAPAEIAKTAPDFIYSQDGNLTEDKVQSVVKKLDGNIIAITENGTEIYYLPDEEQYNKWFIKVNAASTDNITVLMSAAMYSQDNVLKTQDIFTRQNANHNLKKIQDGITTIAALKLHDTKDSSLRGTLWPTYKATLPDIYNGEVPTNGKYILDKSLEYALSIASKDGGKTVKLVDGTIWDTSKKILFVVKRDFSDAEITDFNKKNLFVKNSLPTKISVDPQTGQLKVESLSFLTGGIELTGVWQTALNLLMAPYNPNVIIQTTPEFGREVKVGDPELSKIIYPSDGMGSISWIWDAFKTEAGNITSSAKDKLTWQVSQPKK